MADNDQVLVCPACQKQMKKIFMPEQGVNLDICIDGCGGIYFDNREFKNFDEQHENIDALIEAIEGKEFEKVDESLIRKCPVCGSNMVKNFSSVKREIQIDECYFCGGKFLDNGELIKIREEYATEADRSADLLKAVYKTVSNVNGMGVNDAGSPLNKLFYSFIKKR